MIFNPENLQFIFREKNNKGSKFTVKSLLTGKDYTFKIKRSFFNGFWYTHVYVETQYLKFINLGIYFNKNIYKNKQVVSTPSANAAAWLLRQVEKNNFSVLKQNVELMHFGSCIVCGKTLTDAHSIENGIGPICMSISK
jgi:hypothetical protein